MSTAIIAVVLRLCLRSSLRHGLSSDDYTIAASLVGLEPDHSDRIVANHSPGCWDNRSRMPHKTRPRRNGKAYILPTSRAATASPKMEHHIPNLQRNRNRPLQNLRLPLRPADHRQGPQRPSSLPLDRHRIRSRKPPRASNPLPRPMQAHGRDMESPHQRKMLLPTHHLSSRLYRLRSRRLHRYNLRRHPNLHLTPPTHEHANEMGALPPHGPRLPNRRLRDCKSYHP